MQTSKLGSGPSDAVTVEYFMELDNRAPSP